jgi:dihydroorotate dehydrogenase electron transfer subunit
MQEYTADIIRTEPLGNTTFHLELTSPELASLVVPGQFFQIRTNQFTDPFLRRTVSVGGADRTNGIIHLFVDVVGPGTELLCDRGCGMSLSMIGPLGHGFDLSTQREGTIVLIAGGIGAAPLVFLAHELEKIGCTDILFLMGARNREGTFFVERFLNNTIRRKVSTDDGSVGHHGFVTDLMEDTFRNYTPPIIYSCGPKPMMQRVALFAAQKAIRCQVSLEERMACGIGACYGCAVEQKNGRMARICVEGPVFEGDTIIWS